MDAGRNRTVAEPPQNGQVAPATETPRSIKIASEGISTSRQAANFLSALIGDVMTDKVGIRPAQTSVSAMGKLLKVVDMEHRYGRQDQQDKTLVMAEVPATPGCVERRRKELLEELNRLN